jgi:hypothetical protein
MLHPTVSSSVSLDSVLNSLSYDAEVAVSQVQQQLFDGVAELDERMAPR